MRRAPIHLFDNNVTIQALAQTSGGTEGQWTQSWTNSLTSIPARIQPRSSRCALEHGAQRERQLFVIFVEPGQAIYAGQRASFTDTDQTTRTCDILAVKEAQMAGTVLRLDCREILD